MKESVDGYKGGTLVPSVQISMKLLNPSKPQSLEQRVVFKGVQPEGHFITIKREPKQQGV